MPALSKLKNLKDSRKDDYDMSRKLREGFRKERNRIKEDKEKYKSLKNINLLKGNNTEEVNVVNKMFFKKDKKIEKKSIFGAKFNGKEKIMNSLIKNLASPLISEKNDLDLELIKKKDKKKVLEYFDY
jgi:hypothetical protein